MQVEATDLSFGMDELKGQKFPASRSAPQEN